MRRREFLLILVAGMIFSRIFGRFVLRKMDDESLRFHRFVVHNGVLFWFAKELFAVGLLLLLAS